MRAGHVLTLRVNPRDCQSVLDVLDAAGVPRHGISFAQCTSLALGALLETARQNGLIPEPDEFQYLNRMQEYLGHGRRSQKARIANELNNLGSRLRAPAMGGEAVQSRAGSSTSLQTPRPAEPATPRAEVSPEEVAKAQKELLYLVEEKERLEEYGSWTPEDEKRFQAAYRIVYPDG